MIDHVIVIKYWKPPGNFHLLIIISLELAGAEWEEVFLIIISLDQAWRGREEVLIINFFFLPSGRWKVEGGSSNNYFFSAIRGGKGSTLQYWLGGWLVAWSMAGLEAGSLGLICS